MQQINKEIIVLVWLRLLFWLSGSTIDTGMWFQVAFQHPGLGSHVPPLQSLVQGPKSRLIYSDWSDLTFQHFHAAGQVSFCILQSQPKTAKSILKKTKMYSLLYNIYTFGQNHVLHVYVYCYNLSCLSQLFTFQQFIFFSVYLIVRC